MCARARGFTLAEALVGSGLILLILLVVGQSVVGAVRSHRRGEAQRRAAVFAREALNKIANEMGTAIAVGLLPNGGELSSGVVYPDYAPGVNTPFSGGLYRREHGTKRLPSGENLAFDRAYNRLIMTAPGKRLAQFRDSLDDFVFLEYVVPPRVESPEVPQNCLYRRAFRFQSDPLASQSPGLQLLNNYLIVQGSFFAIDPKNPLGNPQLLESHLSAEQRQERSLLLELPEPEDRIQFRVEHDAAQKRRTTPLPRDPAFETALFTISVQVDLDRLQENQFLGSHVISQQVTIKSGF